MFVNVVAASHGASQSQRDGLTLMTEALSSVAAGKPTVVHTSLLFLLPQPKPFSFAISSTLLPNPKNLLSRLCRSVSVKKWVPCSLTNETLSKRINIGRSSIPSMMMVMPLRVCMALFQLWDSVRTRIDGKDWYKQTLVLRILDLPYWNAFFLMTYS